LIYTRKMNLQKWMEKIDAKIDNFTKVGTAAMTEQRNLLESISSEIGNSTIGSLQSRTNETINRDENIDRKLNEQLQRDFIALQTSLMERFTEQKSFYESQILETKTQTKQALACLRDENRALADAAAKMEQDITCLRNENETMRLQMADLKFNHEKTPAEDGLEAGNLRNDFTNLQTTLALHATEMESFNNQLIEGRTKTEEALRNLSKETSDWLLRERDARILTNLKTEEQINKTLEKIETNIEKLSELKIQVNQLTFNDEVRDDFETNALRQINKAFDEFPTTVRTQEKFKNIIRNAKLDKETPKQFMRSKNLVKAIRSRSDHNKSDLYLQDTFYEIVQRAESVLAREEFHHFSLDYYKLLLALSEIIDSF
jgi:hypothetical protein